MKNPTITMAREAARLTGARGAIVLVFGGERGYAGASYGETKRECAALGKLLDAIGDGLERDGPVTMEKIVEAAAER